jgi:hypothetical protein
MKLLNPLFDSVFKYLLEDLEVAKNLIQAIIKKEVLDLIPAPQEASDVELKHKYSQIGMIRQDYVAIIKTLSDTGKEEIEKVMIEVQKSPIAPEISRFRNYLSDKYRKKSSLGKEEKYLTIKTIYLIEEVFNSKLPAVLGRRGVYYDELENQQYSGEKDEIVELFNHDSWFIQTELLPSEFKDELMYILSVFAPLFRKSPKDRFIDIPDDKILIKKHKILERILRRLQAATQDTKINTSVDIEIDYENFIENNISLAIEYKEKAEQERKQKEEAEKKAEQERKQKEEAEKKAEQERKQKEEAEKKAEQERKQKEEAKVREEETKRKLAHKMKKYNEPIDEIIKETGLTREEIEKL